MKLNKIELKNIIFGAINIKENDDYLIFRRFTDELIEYYKNTSDTFYTRSLSSAGMTMDFETDSNFLAFNYKCYPGSSQPFFSIDVYSDDTLIFHTEKELTSEYEDSLHIDLNKGTKRVTVYFSNLFGIALKNVEFSDNAKVTPLKKERKIIFFGDSITQGYISKYPSLSYANLVTKALNAECLNQGIGGDCFNAENLVENPDFNPDTVFVAYGTNDWNQGKDIEKNAKEYFDKLTVMYSYAKIYVLLPLWRGKPGLNNKMPFDKMREILNSVCKKYEALTVIDAFDFIPHYPAFFAPDILHPNELGFTMYAKEILKCVK